MTATYAKLAAYIEYFHIKDAKREIRQFVAAGEGDGEFQQIISAVSESQFSGFMSIEPHLGKALPDLSPPEISGYDCCHRGGS